MKQMTVNELRDFIFEYYYRRMGFARENSYYSVKHQKIKDLQLFATKLAEQIPDPSSAKEYYNSYLRRKDMKSVKRSKINTEQLKAVERPNT